MAEADKPFADFSFQTPGTPTTRTMPDLLQEKIGTQRRIMDRFDSVTKILCLNQIVTSRPLALTMDRV